MYMLGLLEDAQLDFELVTTIYPKEQLGHFNLALTYFQLGEYKKAICSLEPLFHDATAALIELQRIHHSHRVAHLGQFGKCHADPNKEKHYDFELLEDAFMLKAKAHFRLPSTPDSHQQTLTSLNYSKKFKIWRSVKTRHMKHQYSRKELETELVDQHYKEFKMDIRDSYEIYLSTLSRSQPKELAAEITKVPKEIIKIVQKLQRANSMRPKKSMKITSEALTQATFKKMAAGANERKNSVADQSRDHSLSSSDEDEQIATQFPRSSQPGITQHTKVDVISKMFS